MIVERRATPNPLDVAGILAILYTAGYICMVGLLFFVVVPVENKEPLLQLFGLMSAIQMALIAFYFGSSKSGEMTQRAIEQRQGRAEATIQEMVKINPPIAPIKSKDVSIDATGADISITDKGGDK